MYYAKATGKNVPTEFFIKYFQINDFYSTFFPSIRTGFIPLLGS